MADGHDSSGPLVNCVICSDVHPHEKCSEVKSCGHRFCNPCIERWAQSCSQCPLCKREMGALSSLGCSKPTRRCREGEPEHLERAVPRRRLQVTSSDDFAPSSDIACEVCGGDDMEALLLLCDECDAGYHTFCLEPALPEVPSESWYCPRCSPGRPQAQQAGRGRPPGRSSFLGPGAAGLEDMALDDQFSIRHNVVASLLAVGASVVARAEEHQAVRGLQPLASRGNVQEPRTNDGGSSTLRRLRRHR